MHRPRRPMIPAGGGGKGSMRAVYMCPTCGARRYFAHRGDEVVEVPNWPEPAKENTVGKLAGVLVLALLVGGIWWSIWGRPNPQPTLPVPVAQNQAQAAPPSRPPAVVPPSQPLTPLPPNESAYVRAKGWNPGNIVRSGRLSAVMGIQGVSGGTTWVFFFYDGQYLGTDTFSPSNNSISSVVASGSDQITVRYGLYKRSDPLCCPSGGHEDVRFAWNGQRLQALDYIPEARVWQGP